MTGSQNPFINYTEATSLLSGVDTVEGSSPRWVGIGKLLNEENARLNSTVTILAIDSVKEKVEYILVVH